MIITPFSSDMHVDCVRGVWWAYVHIFHSYQATFFSKFMTKQLTWLFHVVSCYYNYFYFHVIILSDVYRRITWIFLSVQFIWYSLILRPSIRFVIMFFFFSLCEMLGIKEDRIESVGIGVGMNTYGDDLMVYKVVVVLVVVQVITMTLHLCFSHILCNQQKNCILP